jgi:hypothetical protein
MPTPRLTGPFRAVQDSLDPQTRSRLSELAENGTGELEALLERARESCRRQAWKDSGVPLYKEHAIDPVIGDARPYERYDSDNLSPVESEYEDLHEVARALMQHRAEAEHDKGFGGHLIKRHVPAILSDILPRIYAEMRPDDDVLVGVPHWYFRPLTRPHREDFPLYPSGMSAGKRVRASRCFPRDEADEPERWDTWRDRHHIIWPDPDRQHGDLYLAQKKSHYLFPPTPKCWIEDWPHDHANWDATPEQLDAHKKDWHRRYRDKSKRVDPDIEGPHTHWMRVPDGAKNYAKRIDMHPLAALIAKEAELVFFCIEGCIKADAILSEILRTGLKATVVSVPSVTLWGPGEKWHEEFPELQLVADRYFRGKDIVIVCDRDWEENPLVQAQALFCRTTLQKRLGWDTSVVTALKSLPAGPKTNADILAACGWGVVVAAPTAGKGFDDDVVARKDEVGIAGDALAQLRAVIRDAPLVVDTTQGRPDTQRGDAEVLYQVSLHSFKGALKTTLRSVGRITGRHHNRARDALGRLDAAGHLSVKIPSPRQQDEPSLETEQNAWRGRYYDRSEQFVTKPTRVITISKNAHARNEFWPLWKLIPRHFENRWQATESAPHRRSKMALATVSTAQLDRIEQEQQRSRLHVSMQGEKLDHILEVLYAFQNGETPADEWERYLDDR